MRKQFVFTLLVAAFVVLAAFLAQPTTANAQGTTLVPVYRFYFHGTGGFYKDADAHMFRTGTVPPGEGWKNEGLAFYISQVQLPYTVPLYVVYHDFLVDHFYTTDVAARDYLITTTENGGVQYENQGILGYVLPADRDYPGSTPLYRWVRAYRGGLSGDKAYQDHFYYTSAGAVPNYTAEGIACNVWTQPLNLPQKLIEYVSPTGTTLHVNDNPTITWKVWSNSGSVRISFSTDGGGSWRPITTIPNYGAYGEVTVQSYKLWKVPSEAAGKTLIKVDLLKGYANSQKPGVVPPAPPAGQLPWATDMGPVLTVQSNLDNFRQRRPNNP